LLALAENGHLAFNDPPADFTTETPYIVVNLDAACKQQQMGEGWFRSIEDVPQKAISMSVKHIMKSKNIICSVPDERKAIAVKNCLDQEISNLYPASILQTHANCIVYLDQAAASLLHDKAG
jgi:glucosamine-6-phosphate deaminase